MPKQNAQLSDGPCLYPAKADIRRPRRWSGYETLTGHCSCGAHTAFRPPEREDRPYAAWYLSSH